MQKSHIVNDRESLMGTDSDGVYTTKKNLAKYFWTVVEQRFKAFWNLWNQNQADIMFCNETHFQL